MDKKIFLIVSANENRQKNLTDLIHQQVLHPTIYTAGDGSTGLAKIKNVPPHVLLIDIDLPKVGGFQFVDQILKDPVLESLAIVFADPPPNSEKYMDELVTGRIQFVMKADDFEEFTRCLTKSLNYSRQGQKQEYHSKYLAQGEHLMRQGDQAQTVYILRKGSLLAYQMIDGNKVVLGTIAPGEFVGEMAFIHGEPRSANVEALVACELIEIPIGTFELILYKRPAWAKTMMQILSKRLKSANKRTHPDKA